MHVSIFLEDAARSKEFQDFTATLYPHGITYMSHTIRDQNGEAKSFYSDSTWGRHFIKQGYLKQDAVMNHSFNTNTLFIPWKSVGLTESQRIIYNVRENDFKKYNGLTISFRDKNYHHTIGLATDTKTFNLPDYCLKHPQVLMDCMNLFKNSYSAS